MKLTIVLFFESLMAQIYFSEVMFDLDGSDSPNEFIEIYNAELSINESGAKTGLLS